MVISRRRRGACDALRWKPDEARYRCGALDQPLSMMRASLPPYLQWLAPSLTRILKRFGQRWIAAGSGCDSTLETEPRRIVAARSD